MMPDFKDAFTNYIRSSNTDGSGKASSYIRAIDLLCEMLKTKPFGFEDCKDIWSVSSVDRIHELYFLVLSQARKNDKSEWNIPGIPKSYLQCGYCSAALKSFQLFLVENNYEERLLDVFDQNKDNEGELPDALDVDISNKQLLIEGLDELQGKDVVRSVRVRSNQFVFRKIILRIYNQSCCITGLNIPEINRASHIVPWVDDETIRLDPRNGLCLSATYDAAFDRNLISLDDDYRIIVSKEISERYTSEIVKQYFTNKVGRGITLPISHLPRKDFLSEHRSKGSF